MGGSSPGDDAFLIFVRFVPIVFVVAGVLVVIWLSRQRLPHELAPDVLAALSETEALPSLAIRQRPPLAHQDVDLGMLEQILNQMCVAGQVVRWYDPSGDQPMAVYRRVGSAPIDGGVR
jgi:hypothetical protein